MTTKRPLPVLFMILSLAAIQVPAADAEKKPLPDLVAQAREALRKGEPAQAVDLLTRAVTADPKNSEALIWRARAFEWQREFAKAIEDYNRLVELEPESPDAWQARGSCHFRQGKITKSIEDFDRVIKLAPSQEPHHWQRGISYYYAGRFADGKRQFETHQTVNPQDVENAVWHFICAARLSSVDKARESFIPITGDRRVPMKEVHALFSGKGTEEAVLNAARKQGEGRESDPLFYAHLYLGLYYEASGEADKSFEHIKLAATGFNAAHYMGDVARVHYQLRTAGKKP